MITAKLNDSKVTIDFSTTMFFHELMLCPSDKRLEFISHIEKKDGEWLVKFCIDTFGSKIFYFEKQEVTYVLYDY